MKVLTTLELVALLGMIEKTLNQHKRMENF